MSTGQGALSEGRYEPTPRNPMKSHSQRGNEQPRRELARMKMERDVQNRGRQ